MRLRLLRTSAVVVMLSINLPFNASPDISAAGQDKTAAAQDESRGIIVRIKNENGQTYRLYDESHALVIGVSYYNNGWPILKGVFGDVIAVGGMLKKQGFNVIPIINPTHDALHREIRDFISEYGQNERNRLLIYFAGHGYTEELKDGRDIGYIVPADAPLPDRDPKLFNRRAISMDEIEAFAKKIKAKHALFVFDSCFSGSIFEVRSVARTPPSIESSTAGPVRQFITAGTKNQTVPDQSIFRVYFMRAFEQREGDMNRDGYITGEELGHYLAGRVARETWDAQTPRHGKINNGYLNLGDFVFELPNKGTNDPDNAILDDPEDVLWKKALSDNNYRGFQVYWNIYCEGEGKYCHMALEKLRALKPKLEPSQPSDPVTPEKKEAWAAQSRADQLRIAGRLDDAIVELTKAIRLHPAYADAYVSRGHAYSLKANYKRAIDDYDQAVRLDPTNKTTFQNRGYCHAQLGEYGKAIKDYTVAIAIDPNDFLAFHNRGVAYNNNKNYRKAVSDFSATINLNPQYIEAYRNRAVIYRILGQIDLAIADENAAQRLAGQ